MNGSLPPNSKTCGIKCSAALLATIEPVSLPPITETPSNTFFSIN